MQATVSSSRPTWRGPTSITAWPNSPNCTRSPASTSAADEAQGYGVPRKGESSMSASPYIRRATTSVLIAVALIGGAILLLGDRFDAVPGYALTQPVVRVEARMAACVAEESMRL